MCNNLWNVCRGKKRDDNLVRLYSVNFPDKEIIEFDLTQLEYEKQHNWANYPKGMIRYIKEAGYVLPSGFECVIEGNIPNGAGLSSSASIELLTGVLLDGLFGLGIARIDMIKIGKKLKMNSLVLTVALWTNLQSGWEKRTLEFCLIARRYTISTHLFNLKVTKS